MEKEKNESYIRWQNIRITQLGFANNIIIGLSVGSLAYFMNFITKTVSFNFYQKILIWLGCPLLLISCLLGLILIINRLEDFRITSQIARKRELGENMDIEILRSQTKEIGKKTWNLFIWQVSTFFSGFVCLIVIIAINFIQKIT
jgi:hypothetical protein